MAREIYLGKDAKLWYQTIPNLSDQNLPAAWIKNAVLADQVSNVGVSISQNVEDWTPRGGIGESFLGNYQLRHSIQFNADMPWDPTQAFLSACITANSAKSAISICILDKESAADNKGVCSNVWVGLSFTQGIRDIQSVDLSFIPFNYTRWVSGLTD